MSNKNDLPDGKKVKEYPWNVELPSDAIRGSIAGGNGIGTSPTVIRTDSPGTGLKGSGDAGTGSTHTETTDGTGGIPGGNAPLTAQNCPYIDYRNKIMEFQFIKTVSLDCLHNITGGYKCWSKDDSTPDGLSYQQWIQSNPKSTLRNNYNSAFSDQVDIFFNGIQGEGGYCDVVAYDGYPCPNDKTMFTWGRGFASIGYLLAMIKNLFLLDNTGKIKEIFEKCGIEFDLDPIPKPPNSGFHIYDDNCKKVSGVRATTFMRNSKKIISMFYYLGQGGKQLGLSNTTQEIDKIRQLVLDAQWKTVADKVPQQLISWQKNDAKIFVFHNIWAGDMTYSDFIHTPSDLSGAIKAIANKYGTPWGNGRTRVAKKITNNRIIQLGGKGGLPSPSTPEMVPDMTNVQENQSPGTMIPKQPGIYIEHESINNQFYYI